MIRVWSHLEISQGRDVATVSLAGKEPYSRSENDTDLCFFVQKPSINLRSAYLKQTIATFSGLMDRKFVVANFRKLLSRTVVCSEHEVWLPEDRCLLSRMYVLRARVFWHEEIAKPIG
jgi:hypothetical protein